MCPEQSIFSCWAAVSTQIATSRSSIRASTARSASTRLSSGGGSCMSHLRRRSSSGEAADATITSSGRKNTCRCGWQITHRLPPGTGTQHAASGCRNFRRSHGATSAAPWTRSCEGSRAGQAWAQHGWPTFMRVICSDALSRSFGSSLRSCVAAGALVSALWRRKLRSGTYLVFVFHGCKQYVCLHLISFYRDMLHISHV